MIKYYKKTPEETIGGCLAGADPIFDPAQCLTIMYETKPELIKEILPPPLKPYEKPYVIVTYNNFMGTNFEMGGYESTQLLIPAVYEGRVGNFVAAQICNKDMCTVLGREKYGYPKKVGICEHRYDEDRFVGYSARHGVPFVIVDADFSKEPNDPNFLAELTKATQSDPERPTWAINWTYKFEIGEHEDNLLVNPRLVRGWKNKEGVYEQSKAGFGKLTLIPSVDDPWFELEPVRVVGALLSHVNSHMKCANPVGRIDYIPVDKDAYLPYAFYGYDRSFKNECK